MLVSVVAAARPSLRGPSDDDDVPASVTCAVCGAPDSECLGCASPTDRRLEPRTPWEDPRLSRWQRLLLTARLVTVEGEAFFGTLPDGSVRSALGFAFLCELLAIGSLVLAWLPIVYAFVPGYIDELLADPGRRHLAIAVVAAAVPALSVFMVGLHLLWALALELGLVLAGARGRMAHCARYALYSCGWDFVTSPCGFAAGCVAQGFHAARSEIQTAIRVPRFATTAYVGRARALSDKAGRVALLIAVLLTGSIVLVSAFALGAALVRTLV
jgi:hypothetical protein